MDPQQGGQIFARKASGLVRVWSWWDMFLYQIVGAFVFAAYFLYLSAWIYPNSLIWLTYIIAGILFINWALVYCWLGSAIPRAGGDYTFVSRILPAGGFLGYAFNLPGTAMVQMIWGPIFSVTISFAITSPLFFFIGLATKSSWWFAASSWWLGPNGIFFGAVIVAVWGAIITILGMRLYARVQRGFMYVGLAVLAVILGMLAYLFANPSIFQNNLNSLAAQIGVSGGNVYQAVITQAQTAGFNPTPAYSWFGTIAGIAIPAEIMMYFGWAIYQVGEMKGADSVKNMNYGLVLSAVFQVAMWALIAFLSIGAFGRGFLGANAYLSSVGTSPLPFSSTWVMYLFAAFWSQPWLAVGLLILVYIGWAVMLMPVIQMGGARLLFAMSFDRLLPDVFSKVGTRRRAPVYAILAISLGCVIFGALYAYVSIGGISFSVLTYDVAAMQTIAFSFTLLAAIVFPWRRKDIFNASPAARYRIGKLPLVTLNGVIAYGTWLFVMYEFITNSNIGVNNPLSALFIACSFVGAVILYYVFKYKRGREGIDVSLIFKEVPVA